MANSLRYLEIESWTLWTIGAVLIVLRMISRRIQAGGWNKLQLDDGLMIIVLVTFTVLTVAVNLVARLGSNYLPPGAAELLTPGQTKDAVLGSKWVMINEEMMLCTTWLVKTCLLMTYHKLTKGLKENKFVKLIAVWVAFGFVIIQILFLGVWCRPFDQYFAVPVRAGSKQCATYTDHMITASVFNISSDVMMLVVILPLLIRTKLPVGHKTALVGIFSLGIFVILAAVLNRYYTFTQPYSPIYLNWYVGEAASMVYVSNILLLWPLIRRVFRAGVFQRSSGAGTGPSGTGGKSGNTYGRGTRGTVNGKTRQGDRIRLPSENGDGDEFNSSKERIVGGGAWLDEEAGMKNDMELRPIVKSAKFRNDITSGDTAHEGAKRESEEKEGIVKTVEINQYHSG